VVQRFNSVLLHDGFIDDNLSELGSLPNKFCNFCNFCATRGSPGQIIIIIIIIIIIRQFIRRSNMVRVITRAPYNVCCLYSGNKREKIFVLSMFLKVDNVGAERKVNFRKYSLTMYRKMG